MSVNGYRFSYHILKERADRIESILATGGFGEEVKRIPSRRGKNNVYEVLTDTGVVMVVNETIKFCLTVYKASHGQLVRFAEA